MLEKIVARIRWATFVLTALLMVFLVCLVILAVVMRYALGQPIIYSYDLSALLFAWTVFLGMALAERAGAHMSIVNLSDFTGPRLGKALTLLRLVILLVIALVMLWFGGKLLAQARMSIPSMGISIGWLYASVPIGFALLTLEYLCKIVATTRGGPSPATGQALSPEHSSASGGRY